MKIIYLSGAYLPSRGANAVHVMHQCAALVNLGHEVTLIARTGNEYVDLHAYYGVERCFEIDLIPRNKMRVLGALWWAARVAARVRRKKAIPDLIYSREVWALSLSVIGTRIPFIHEKHWTVAGFEKRTEQWLLGHPSCAGFVYISQALRRIYTEAVPQAAAAPGYIAHDAAQDRPEPLPPQRDGPLHVGYVGSFRDGYGIEMIVSLAKTLTDIRFTVVGGSPEDIDRVLRETCAAALDNLTFAGFIAPFRLDSFYTEFDITLAPYDVRTDHIDWISPMKLFEYMAHGRGVLCSDFPVLREIIKPGLNGDLLPPGDLSAWVARLKELDKNPEYYTGLGSRAFAHFKAHHTWHRRGDGILKALVPRLLDGSGG